MHDSEEQKKQFHQQAYTFSKLYLEAVISATLRQLESKSVGLIMY